MELSGVLAPLPTPLTDDGSSISEIRLLRLLQKLQSFGVSGYVACGEVGEFGAISYAERKAFAEMVLRNTASTPQVVVNVSSLSTVASLDLAQHAARHGAKACVLMPPYYGPLTADEHFNFLRVVGQYAGLPVIVVDPHRLLEPEVREKAANVTGLFLASPTFWAVTVVGASCTSWIDEFSLEPGACTVMSLVQPVERLFMLPEENIRKLGRFTLTHGSARVVKAAFGLQGIDLGPLRGPRLALPQEAVGQLQAMLGIG